jgi:Protein of unknown function (DUF4435)
MNSNFQTINDTKYHFISDIEVRNAILKAGRKKIAFVEGYDDKVIFDIIYEENLASLAFIDISIQNRRTGGCEEVTSVLEKCVLNLPTNKRFFGIVDRDLNTDEEIEAEKNLPCYDNRLFIFTERYTLENYFIDIDVLTEFLTGQSINYKGLIPLMQDVAKLTEIVNEIILCLASIAVANFTIHHFDSTRSFIEKTIDCAEDAIKHRIFQNMNHSAEQISQTFDCYKNLVGENGLKFASAKDYFATQFNIHLKNLYKVNIQINNHKSELARILKKRLPAEFKQLHEFIMVNKS